MKTRDFAECSVIDTIVPQTSEIDLEHALRALDVHDKRTETSLVPSIRQRQTLFFDESTDVYVVLRTSYLEEDALKRFISRLTIRVEAHVVNVQSQSRQDGQATPTRDLIFSDTLKESEDPMTVFQAPDHDRDEGDPGHVFVFWKLKASLSHPRARISSPMVVFSVLATLRPATQVIGGSAEQRYLPSAVPADFNLLESLRDDPALGGTVGGTVPYLSASRISRFAPATHPAKESIRPLRQYTKRSFRVVHAASARLRYSRSKGYDMRPTVLASLEFEVAPSVDCELYLEKAEMRLARGAVEPLTTGSNVELPLACQTRDQIVLLYRFTPDEDFDTHSPNNLQSMPLEISITATASVSEDCRPHIVMRWRTSVDFSMPLNPSFAGAIQHLRRPHRPSSLPVPPPSSPPSAMSSTAPSNAHLSFNGPDSASSLDPASGRQRAYSTGDFGVTVTFSGPRYTYVGETFKWDVFAVNRSGKVRMLAVLALPRSRTTTKRHASKSSSSSAGVRGEHNLADLVLDENVVYAMQKNAVIEPAALVNLSTDDLRIGPLQPGACLAAELKFVALQPGALHIEAVRIVDIGTNDTVYVRDLPDIVALPKAIE